MFQDLRYALRVFAKAPSFTLVAVLVLAIGIGANTAMFTVVNAFLFKALSGQAGELVGVYSRDLSRPDEYRAFSFPNYVDIRDQSHDVFEGLMAYTFAMVGAPKADGTQRKFVAIVSSNYFDTIGVVLAAGRTFTADEERPRAGLRVVVVGYDRWQEAGFDPSFIGSRIRINATDYTIIGVAPRGFTGTMALVAPDMWLPLGTFDAVAGDMFNNGGTDLTDRRNDALILAGRLKAGVDSKAAGSRLEAIGQQLAHAYPDHTRDQSLVIRRLSRVSTSTSPQTDMAPAVGSVVLMAMASTVLIIACLNLANMLLARGSSRRKEIAVRLAIGGGRRRIVRQLLTESLLLALFGSVAGLLLAFWSTRLLFTSLAPILPLTLTFEPTPDRNVLIAAMALASVATLLFGAGPALRISRVDIFKGLQATGGGNEQTFGSARFTARNVLVVGQIALSLALLCTGGLVARGALAAGRADPGFRYDRLLLVSIDPGLAGYDEARGRAAHRVALDAIRSIPGVDSAAFTSTVPFGEFHEGIPVQAVGSATDAKEGRSPTYRIIGTDYFRALGLRMVRGREFTRVEEESTNAPRVAVVDEHLARRLFGDQDPLGQMIRVRRGRADDGPGEYGEPMEIVGVAPALRDTLFDRAPVPHVYVPWGRNYRTGMNIYVRATRPGAEAEVDILTAIRREVTKLDPQLPVLNLLSMSRFHDRSVELWAVRAAGKMITALGLLALLLAVIGVYGVKSYLVSQRTREIGIRIAVGARPRDVLWLILREGMSLTAVGLAIGLPLGALAGFALSRVLYEVSPLDPMVFVLAPVALGTASMAASWLPALRATRVAPTTALRAE